jgi:hypothetical protein
VRALATALACAVALGLSASSAAAQAPSETIGEVRVHGNHTTPDADILALAGLTVGGPVDDLVLRQAADRLRQSHRFTSAEVRKRFRSIDNPADILVIILVDERAGVSETDLRPGPLKRMGSTGMWLPILDYEDGYGFTYGAQVSFVDVAGPRSRLTVPLTWGGERRVGIGVDRVLERGPVGRLEGGVSIARRENPHFLAADTRTEARLRAERALTTWLRVGGGARVTSVRFGSLEDHFVAPALDVIVDTRIDPAFPRNAVHAEVGIEQLRVRGAAPVDRWSADVRGYVGLFGSSVIALRAVTSRADRSLPAYEQVLLGGGALLRGYAVGYRAGDNAAAFSAEVRTPLTSPLSVGRFGVKAFVDAGTVSNAGASLSSQRFDRSVGAGAFLTAPMVRVGLDVAWPRPAFASGFAKPRWHFGLGVAF